MIRWVRISDISGNIVNNQNYKPSTPRPRQSAQQVFATKPFPSVRFNDPPTTLSEVARAPGPTTPCVLIFVHSLYYYILYSYLWLPHNVVLVFHTSHNIILHILLQSVQIFFKYLIIFQLRKLVLIFNLNWDEYYRFEYKILKYVSSTEYRQKF